MSVEDRVGGAQRSSRKQAHRHHAAGKGLALVHPERDLADALHDFFGEGGLGGEKGEEEKEPARRHPGGHDAIPTPVVQPRATRSAAAPMARRSTGSSAGSTVRRSRSTTSRAARVILSSRSAR